MPRPCETPGPVRRVPLDSTGSRWALLREIDGFDEQGVCGRDTLAAIRLVDSLLVDEPGVACRPGEASTLTVRERDFLLAAAWQMSWSSTIGGTLGCDACARPFSYDFDLASLVDVVRTAVDDLPEAAGVYTLPGGCRFRLPTGDDERAVLGLPTDEAEQTLLARCIVAGDARTDAAAVLVAMERVGRSLDLDLTAHCSECGHPHTLSFRMQDYLLGALVDWRGLVEDAHRLALAYRWSLHEILSLAHSRRRAFIALLDGDAIPRVWSLP